MKEKIKEYIEKVKGFLFEQEKEDEEESLVEILYKKRVNSSPQN